MGVLREWRHQNPLWKKAMSNFSLSKRTYRTIGSHPLRYWQYYYQCKHSLIARMIAEKDNTLALTMRPCNKYLHRGWSSLQRIEAASATLHILDHYFDHRHSAQLFVAEAKGMLLANISLKTGEQAQIRLMHSRYVREGELGLYLFAEGYDQPLYSLTFSFGEGGKLLYLTGLQGPCSATGQELVREMTKALHGIRPKNLLLSASYAMAENFGIEHIYGICDDYQIKHHQLKCSYDSFWQELASQQQPAGWYQLPRYEAQRSIEEVASKHRSAFRKREALRQQMIRDIRHHLHHAMPLTAERVEGRKFNQPWVTG